MRESKDVLLTELEGLPDPYAEDVLRLVRFLKARIAQGQAPAA